MRAEREKRAVILTSEGQRDATINTAEGGSAGDQGTEASRQRRINEAEGRGAIHARGVATRHSTGGRAIRTEGGMEAVQPGPSACAVRSDGGRRTPSVPAFVSDVAGMILPR